MKFADQKINLNTMPFAYSYFSVGYGWENFLAVDLIYNRGDECVAVSVAADYEHLEAACSLPVIQKGESIKQTIQRHGEPDLVRFERFCNAGEDPDNWIKEELLIQFSEFLKAID